MGRILDFVSYTIIVVIVISAAAVVVVVIIIAKYRAQGDLLARVSSVRKNRRHRTSGDWSIFTP